MTLFKFDVSGVVGRVNGEVYRIRDGPEWTREVQVSEGRQGPEPFYRGRSPCNGCGVTGGTARRREVSQ